MSLGQTKAITDICLLVEDIDRTIDFYTQKLGYRIRRFRAPWQRTPYAPASESGHSRRRSGD
ncbi:catechol 2,3-dioxygenase-like lactoylglutathione lyase family enzyme [Mesorhizobium robiniae]|uniref:Catechol 2,3-dioxygenase-like lactoylglutathione lyase family enzyme n=1 Tax=Mesorhizobium robiniae TaxID=559315 RepID=A0ABV2GGP5_9HYPH